MPGWTRLVTWSVPLKLHCSLVGAFLFAGFRRTPVARVRSSSVRLLAACCLHASFGFCYGLPHCPASMIDAVTSLSMVVPWLTLYFCWIPDFVKLLMFLSNLLGAVQLISTLSFH